MTADGGFGKTNHEIHELGAKTTQGSLGHRFTPIKADLNSTIYSQQKGLPVTQIAVTKSLLPLF